MGKLNLLQGKWDGKVGQTVGAKWKSKATIRAYAVPSNPNTALQQEKRTVFKDMSSFVALFSDQVKTLTSLNTRGQTVRNAIIQANKDQFGMSAAFDPASLVVNKGGLVALQGLAFSGGALNWTPPVATNISAKAIVVGIWADPVTKTAYAQTALASAGTLAFTSAPPSGSHVYAYMIDYRGSTRVGNYSVHFDA